MKRLLWMAASLLLASGCGGSSYPSAAPSATPQPGTNGTSSTTTIAIVGSSGNQAYTPNPAQVPQGGQVMFKNQDTRTHHIVMDDGSADFGTMAPGDSSGAKALSGGNYHCTIHPSMVGSINGTAAPTPNCPGGYC